MAGNGGPGSVRSIHDLEKIRDGGAPPAIFHDAYRRLSFVDHRADELPDPADWRSGALAATAPAYTAVDVSSEAPGDVVLAGPGSTTKRFSVAPGEAVIRCRIAPGAGILHVGQEFNLTPTSIDETVLTLTAAGTEKPLRPPFEAAAVTSLRLADPHSGVTLSLSSPLPLVVWADRVCTVSNSEAGYEEIPQQIALLVWQPATSGEMDVTVSFAQNGQAVPGIS
jgi:hypothetical protein